MSDICGYSLSPRGPIVLHTSGGPVRSPEKSESLMNGHIWLIIKTHQTNLMAPWYPHTWIFDTKGMTTFFMIRTKGQNMLRCSGQNVNQKLGRTKCQPQKKVRTKCQPLVGISSGWHFVRLAFCPTTPCGRYAWKQQTHVKISSHCTLCCVRRTV